MSLQTKLTFKENKAPTVEYNNMDEVKARVTLQTLQPSAKVKGLVGKDSVKSTKPTKKVQAVNGKIHIFEDSSTSNVSQPKKTAVTMEDKDVQTEDFAVEDQIKSMTTDEISVEYFSVLAERRRVALTEALEENEQLHREIDSLKSEVTTLKAENSVLKPLAEEAEYLAGILKDLVGNAEDEGGNEATETEADDKEDKASQSES